VAALEARLQRLVLLRAKAPALDAALGLEPRDRSGQVTAGDPVGRRERLTRLVEGCLLGYGWAAERAADGDPPEGAGRPAELALHDRAVIVHHP
jgi:hypothetical protein